MDGANPRDPFAAAPADTALRLLTIVQRLGAPAGDADAEEIGEKQLVGEQRLLGFDHLLRHPATLAYVLIEHHRHLPETSERSAALARRIRLLVGDRGETPIFRRARSRGVVPGGRPSYFDDAPVWRRWDDSLAFLASRGLLEVGIAGSQPPQIAYRLTARGAVVLEQRVYPASKAAAAWLQACDAIREFWPAPLDVPVDSVLAATAGRLEELRHDEQIPLEQDLLPVLFERTFRERL